MVRVGDGSAALSSAATPVFLDEYTPAGSLVQSIPLPAATNGATRAFTMSGSATSEGALALSSDGRFVTLAGYQATPGTASIASTASSTTPRVVARVGADGTVDTSTAITDAFSANNVRGAVTDDGTRFWAVGANSGVRLATLGSATSTSVSTTVSNLRTTSIAGGQLYATTGSTPTGVYAIGSGTPTTSGNAAQLVTGAPSPYAAVLLDRDASVAGVDTLYVADDSASPGGGILKFSYDGTSWTARGSFRPAGSGARGLTGSIQPGGSVALVATTTTTPNAMVQVVDSAAYNAPISAVGTTLATAGTNTVLRGIALAPRAPATAPSITTQPQDTTIAPGGTATLTVAASGSAPLAYQWYKGTTGDTSNPVAALPGRRSPRHRSTPRRPTGCG